MSFAPIQQATAHDEHLQQLKGYIIAGWPRIKEQVQQDIRHIGHSEMTWQ